MKKCNFKKCTANKDGICLGNWADCPTQKPEKRISTRMMYLLLIAIVGVCVFVYSGNIVRNENTADAAEAVAVQMEPELYVWKGQYTIIQYTQIGWSNRIYVTEFYVEDDYLYYKLKDHQEEYLLIKAEGFLPVPGWIEDVDELMNYGFWEPMEFDFDENCNL